MFARFFGGAAPASHDAPVIQQAPTATVGLDTNHDGHADTYVTGVDLNHDGIPDVLQQAPATNVGLYGSPQQPPMATVGVDTNHDGRANVYVTGADRNHDGIPDVLQQPIVSVGRNGIPDVMQQPVATVGVDTNHDGRANMYVTGVDRNHDGIPDVLQQPTRTMVQEPMATVGIDTNHDGCANMYVTGVDRNHDGIPDVLQQAPMATVGVDTNHDGRANMYVTGVDRNHDGIPDVLQQAGSAAIPRTGMYNKSVVVHNLASKVVHHDISTPQSSARRLKAIESVSSVSPWPSKRVFSAVPSSATGNVQASMSYLSELEYIQPLVDSVAEDQTHETADPDVVEMPFSSSTQTLIPSASADPLAVTAPLEEGSSVSVAATAPLVEGSSVSVAATAPLVEGSSLSFGSSADTHAQDLGSPGSVQPRSPRPLPVSPAPEPARSNNSPRSLQSYSPRLSGRLQSLSSVPQQTPQLDVQHLILSSLLHYGMKESAASLMREAGLDHVTEEDVDSTQRLRKQRTMGLSIADERREISLMPYSPLVAPGMPAKKASRYREAHEELVLSKDNADDVTVQVRSHTERLANIHGRLQKLREAFPEPTEEEVKARNLLQSKMSRLQQLRETSVKLERTEVEHTQALALCKNERTTLIEVIQTKGQSAESMEAEAQRIQSELETLRIEREGSDTAQAQRIRKLLLTWDAPHGPKRIAAETFAHVDSNHDGRLEWKNDELCMFVRLIFQHHSVPVPPWPAAVWLEMYRLCDLDRSHSLDVVESLKFARCCFEASLRALVG